MLSSTISCASSRCLLVAALTYNLPLLQTSKVKIKHMTENINASAELSVTELSSELESVRNKLQAAEQKIMQLELSLLQSRDFSIGTAAEMGEMRVGHNTIIEKLKDANIHIKSHLAHIKRLEEAMVELNRASALHRARSAELDRVYNSASWKIGRFIMIPIRILRKISS